MTDNRVKLSACLLLLLVCFDLHIQNAESLNLMADLARKLQIGKMLKMLYFNILNVPSKLSTKIYHMESSFIEGDNAINVLPACNVP